LSSCIAALSLRSQENGLHFVDSFLGTFLDTPVQ
jgi:hypothetical protein